MKKEARLGAGAKGALIGGGLGGTMGGLLGYSSPADPITGMPIKKPTDAQRRRSAIFSALGLGASGAYLGYHIGELRQAFKGYQQYTGGGGRAGGRTYSGYEATKPPSWMGKVKTKAEAKKKFRSEAMKHHPDRGGSEEMMKRINTEWEAFEKSPAFQKLAFPFFAELVRIAEVKEKGVSRPHPFG